MSATGTRRELGRGERVLPGLWRLRLPLPWPGVPHGNAWAIAAGPGVVLVDCGLHAPGSIGHLERALDMAGLRLEQVRLLVCTHAHADHYGQAATVVERAGCELWMHPDHGHVTAAAADREASLERRMEIGRASGVPEEPLRRYGEARREQGSGLAAIVLPDRRLVDGVSVDTDLGPWQVVETPGHAPSHVCLFQRERRLLISGDHVLGRVSLYFDLAEGHDAAGEFLDSLERVEALHARLGLSGHGRTFTDVAGHIAASRALVHERLARTLETIGRDGPITAFDAVPRVHGEAVTAGNAGWWLTETLCYLRHLELAGRALRVPGEPERWTVA